MSNAAVKLTMKEVEIISHSTNIEGLAFHITETKKVLLNALCRYWVSTVESDLELDKKLTKSTIGRRNKFRTELRTCVTDSSRAEVLRKGFEIHPVLTPLSFCALYLSLNSNTNDDATDALEEIVELSVSVLTEILPELAPKKHLDSLLQQTSSEQVKISSRMGKMETREEEFLRAFRSLGPEDQERTLGRMSSFRPLFDNYEE